MNLKGLIKNISILGVLRFIVIVLAFLYVWDRCSGYDHSKDRVVVKPIPPASEVIKEAEEIDRAVSDSGRERVVFKMAEPIIQKIEDKTKEDSLLKVLNIERGKVKQISQIAGSLEAENLVLKRDIKTIIDGSKDTSYSYADNWISLTGLRRKDSVTTIEKIWANTNVDQVVHERKKSWFFGATEDVATISYESPYITVNGLKTYTLKKKEPFFDVTLTPKAEFYFNKNHNSLYILPVNSTLRFGRTMIEGGVGVSVDPNSSLNKDFRGLFYKVGIGYRVF